MSKINRNNGLNLGLTGAFQGNNLKRRSEKDSFKFEESKSLGNNGVDSDNKNVHPHEVLGRSQVKKSGRICKIDKETIEKDCKFYQENPKLVELAQATFDLIYQKQIESGVENPYERACELYCAIPLELGR